MHITSKIQAIQNSFNFMYLLHHWYISVITSKVFKEQHINKIKNDINFSPKAFQMHYKKEVKPQRCNTKEHLINKAIS